jgi:hypothetical protein
MTIIEMLEKVGQENISLQYVDECFLAADYDHKNHGVKLKIGTTGITLDDLLSDKPFKKVGVVLWFDRELYPKEAE